MSTNTELIARLKSSPAPNTAQSVQVNAMLVEALENAIKCLNSPCNADLRLVLRDGYAALAAAKQAQPERAPLSDAEIDRHWTNATIELCSFERCYKRGFKDAERYHGIKQGGQHD